MYELFVRDVVVGERAVGVAAVCELRGGNVFNSEWLYFLVLLREL